MQTAPDKKIRQLFEKARGEIRRGPQPVYIVPMMARLAGKNGEETPFPGEGWIFEPKLDGEICVAFRKGGAVRLISRSRKNLNSNYPELVSALQNQPAGDFIVDGEIAALEGGLPSFEKLQPRMQIRDPLEALNTGIDVFYYLFDLLYLEGSDLTGLELIYRKRMLEYVMSYTDPIRYTAHKEEGGREFFKEACSGGWEGIIAKRAASRYVQKRSRDWLKFKCLNEQEFVICGFTGPGGARKGFFGALLLGYYRGGSLVYAGRVGTGFNEYMLKSLGERLSRLERKTSPVNENLPEGAALRNVHWVDPELVCQAAFSQWTKDGVLRQPRFKGLRRDKRPSEVVRERGTG